jgi:two-component system, OmpR family, sensor histidine kinase TctE
VSADEPGAGPPQAGRDTLGGSGAVPRDREAVIIHGPSLRRQLLRPLVWIWLLGMLAATGGAYLLARSSANSAFDRGLQDAASALAAKVTWSDRGPLLDVSRQTMELLTWDLADHTRFAMTDVEGNVLAGDGSVPVPRERSKSFAQPTLFDAKMDGEPVRGAVFSVTSPMLDRSVSVIVVETTHKRAGLVRDIQLGMVAPTLALGTLTFALLASSIRRGLQPLREVAAQVRAHAPNDWSALSLQRVPAEAVPLIERINDLLADVQHFVALQRRFVADAAHQLRTPVAGIRVLAQELEQELAAAHPQAAANASWTPLLHALVGSSDRLARLIGQLLSLARSETALSVNGEQSTLDIVPLLREATEPLVLQGLRAGRSIALDAPEQPVLARAHPLWLGEAVTNLLDNAQRYGGENIVLRVRPLEQGEGAEVIVEDDGEGVPPEHLPRLFEPFWRGERADLRNDGGTGLGLAIAREIIERLGGAIDVVSRPQFAGLKYTIRLAA